MKDNVISSVVLLLSLVALFLAFNYNEYLFYYPQSIHFWRQTDSLVFISGFHKTGDFLFSPSVLNLQCGNGRSVSEFPLVYYIIANISFLYEHKEIALRTIYLAVYFWGLACMYKLYAHFKVSLLLRAAFLLLIASSTILGYYGCNYVPDIYSLGMTLAGIYYYFKYKESKKALHRFIYILVFVLASVSKPIFLLYPAALLCFELSYMIFPSKSSNAISVKKLVNPLLIPVALTLGWYFYVKYYNQSNCSTCFLSTIQPIWNLSAAEIKEVWNGITTMWYTSYYYETTLHLLLIIIVVIAVFIKRISDLVRRILLFFLLGNIAYFLMFFFQFRDHDYYFLCFAPLIGFLPVAFNDVYLSFNEKLPKAVKIILPLAVMVIACLSLNYGNKKIKARYAIVNSGKETVKPEYYSLATYLDEIGVERDAIVVSGPDHTCNATLYFADRKGWTTLPQDFTEEQLREYIHRGASYAIVDRDTMKLNTGALSLFKEKLGQTGDIEVFRLSKN